MIRVLIVDDEPLVAAAHEQYLGRLDGFVVVGVAHSAAEALALLARGLETGAIPDLLLLDVGLPDANGLDLARRLRQSRIDVDIIAVTAVRDRASVQAAVAVGAAHYLIKPFGFAAFRDKLEQYARYRARLGSAAGSATQEEVDELLAALRAPARSTLPKGLSAPTLDLVSAHLDSCEEAVSAAEAAEALALSRVTARRYLEHLADTGVLQREPRYGSPGRPEVAYRRRGA
ncbi:response regulator [Microcella daejeonensis]|uniref:response regulator n=1 Tax=Microcella daejeonensis TaxID=2994971 RepID=UPI00226ED468|nr:response regulator [Microcella daejeonensis]WAB83696.1 response regulator [Microcella daejeonensis]